MISLMEGYKLTIDMSSKNNPISKASLKHLAELARIKLTAKEEVKFLKDLKKIIGYFEEIKEVGADKIEPLTGGHSLKNVFRNDQVDFSEKARSTNEAGSVIGGFSDEERGYLKVLKIL